VKDES
jgi:cyclin-dependent kinase 2